VLEEAGSEVRVMTHVFSWLLLPVWLARKVTSSEPQLGLDRSSRILDVVALVLTRVERTIVQFVPLPFGSSIGCVASPIKMVSTASCAS
jgi:hypothetical protein